MNTKYKELLGMFDYTELNELVSSISETVHKSKEEIYKLLFYEALNKGYTVKKASEQFGITPHVFNDKMIAFYKETDAFIIELVVGHMMEYCKLIDNRVISIALKYFYNPKKCNILVYGDGIGSDSLRFANLGFNVDYFEFPGITSNFAISRFKKNKFGNNIKIITSEENIPPNKYQLIVCREVLEHVPNPTTTINNFWEYLNRDGYIIITESFSRVEELYPTHLLSNLEYANHTAKIFVDGGFKLIEKFEDSKPYVFNKVEKNNQSRFESLKLDQKDKFLFKEVLRYIGSKILSKINI